MNKMTILKSIITIVVIALVQFGGMWIFLFMCNNTDVSSSIGKPFNRNNAQTLIGSWAAIEPNTSHGISTSNKRTFWQFSESEVRYHENDVEVLGHPFAYQWINNDTIKIQDNATNKQLIWQLKFNDDNNLIIYEQNGSVRTLVRITETQ